MSKDYYNILGTTKGASQDEIKKAYRKMAHKYHPDKKGGDEAKFKEVNEAYQVLGDAKKRSTYDQFGSSAFSGSGGGGGGNPFGQGFGGFSSQGGSYQNVNFEDIGIDVEDLFDLFGGGRGRKSQSDKGADIQVSMDIELKDAARGVTREIGINKEATCDKCDGTGAKNKELSICKDCAGTGRRQQGSNSLFGAFMQMRACKTCQGKGKIPKHECEMCRGEGKLPEKDVFEITIPAGIQDGETLVMRGKGQAGFRGGSSGDLYIGIRVRSDSRFKRIDNDLVQITSVKLTDALLGAKMKVSTLDGDKVIDIPAGTTHGDEIRIKGAGVKGPRVGDQIVKVKIEMPKKLSRRARELVEELSREL